MRGKPHFRISFSRCYLSDVAERHLKKGSVGVFTIPGLARLRVTMRPKTKARQGRNPFTGEEITIPAKPARKALHARPVKAIKDKVEGN
ncbi:MAG TPA: DNA-binding protein [Rhizobiales bacterium]|nr:DNA-binding protein [Hyphomicrobiales bacterium]